MIKCELLQKIAGKFFKRRSIGRIGRNFRRMAAEICLKDTKNRPRPQNVSKKPRMRLWYNLGRKYGNICKAGQSAAPCAPRDGTLGNPISQKGFVSEGLEKRIEFSNVLVYNEAII